MSLLDNVNSDRIKQIRALGRASVRRQRGLVLVEGPNPCREAASQGSVQDLYLTEAWAERYADVVCLVESAGGYVHLASARYVEKISRASQGIVAVARWRSASWPSSAALVAVFDQIADPGNAGTVIRAANAMAVDLVVFTAGSVDPSSPKVVRSSAGSVFRVPVLAGPGVGDAALVLGQLRARGCQILAADPRGPIGLDQLESSQLSRPTAWLFGNEAHGLAAAVLGQSDLTVRIEMPGDAESLNLATAAALVLYVHRAKLR